MARGSGQRPVPALIGTTADAPVLLPQLLERGWVPFGDPTPPHPAGELVSW